VNEKELLQAVSKYDGTAEQEEQTSAIVTNNLKK
jgi:hypothetical protein